MNTAQAELRPALPGQSPPEIRIRFAPPSGPKTNGSGALPAEMPPPPAPLDCPDPSGQSGQCQRATKARNSLYHSHLEKHTPNRKAPHFLHNPDNPATPGPCRKHALPTASRPRSRPPAPGQKQRTARRRRGHVATAPFGRRDASAPPSAPQRLLMPEISNAGDSACEGTEPASGFVSQNPPPSQPPLTAL